MKLITLANGRQVTDVELQKQITKLTLHVASIAKNPGRGTNVYKYASEQLANLSGYLNY